MTIVIVWNYRKWMHNPGIVKSQMGDARTLRRQMLRYATVLTSTAFFLWLPGIFINPAMVYRYQKVFALGHLAESSIVHGLLMSVSTSLTHFLLMFLAFRLSYPFLWDDVRNLPATAAKELHGILPRLRLFHWMVGAVPLFGAISLILAGAESFPANGLFSFQILGIGLIVGGLLGLVVIGAVRAAIERTIELFTDATSKMN